MNQEKEEKSKYKELKKNIEEISSLELQIFESYKELKVQVGYPLCGELPENNPILSKEEVICDCLKISQKWIVLLKKYQDDLNGIREVIGCKHYKNEAQEEVENVQLAKVKNVSSSLPRIIEI